MQMLVYVKVYKTTSGTAQGKIIILQGKTASFINIRPIPPELVIY